MTTTRSTTGQYDSGLSMGNNREIGQDRHRRMHPKSYLFPARQANRNGDRRLSRSVYERLRHSRTPARYGRGSRHVSRFKSPLTHANLGDSGSSAPNDSSSHRQEPAASTSGNHHIRRAYHPDILMVVNVVLRWCTRKLRHPITAMSPAHARVSLGVVNVNETCIKCHQEHAIRERSTWCIAS